MPGAAPSPGRAEDGERAADGFNVFDAIELPADWSMEKLGDIAVRVTGGGTPSTKVSQYWDGEIPWTTSAVIREEDIYLTKYQRCITPKGLEESSTQLIPKGSVLIGTRVGVGKSAVTTCDIAISQDLTALVPQPRVSAEFIALALKCAPLASWFEENKRGTTIKGVSRNDILRLMIPLPGLPEQCAIASALLTVQGAKEACKRVMTATRQLKQSLLHHLFTYGPVPFPQAAHVLLKETEVGPMPEHWSVVSIGDIETFMQYGTSSRCESGGSGLPVLRIPNVVGGGIDTADLKYLAASPTEIERHLLQRGDLLFVRTNGVRENVGRCAVYLGSPARSLFASYLIRARLVPDRALPDFVQLFTETNAGRASFTGRASGAADGKFNINTQTIRSTILPLPPLPEQREIAAQLAAVDAKLAAEESRRAALAALFQSLLHHLMTGQVRLPEFERDRR